MLLLSFHPVKQRKRCGKILPLEKKGVFSLLFLYLIWIVFGILNVVLLGENHVKCIYTGWSRYGRTPKYFNRFKAKQKNSLVLHWERWAVNCIDLLFRINEMKKVKPTDKWYLLFIHKNNCDLLPTTFSFRLWHRLAFLILSLFFLSVNLVVHLNSARLSFVRMWRELNVQVQLTRLSNCSNILLFKMSSSFSFPFYIFTFPFYLHLIWILFISVSVFFLPNINFHICSIVHGVCVMK